MQLATNKKVWSTHSGWDKMAAKMTFSNSVSWKKIILHWPKFHWNFSPRAQLTIKQEVQIIVWHPTGEKPLSEPMTLNQFLPLMAVLSKKKNLICESLYSSISCIIQWRCFYSPTTLYSCAVIKIRLIFPVFECFETSHIVAEINKV